MEPDPDGATPSSPQCDGHLNGMILINLQAKTGAFVRSRCCTTVESDKENITDFDSKSCKIEAFVTFDTKRMTQQVSYRILRLFSTKTGEKIL